MYKEGFSLLNYRCSFVVLCYAVLCCDIQALGCFVASKSLFKIRSSISWNLWSILVMILSSISASSAFVTNAVVTPAAPAVVVDSEGGVNVDVTVSGGGRGEGGKGGNGGVTAVNAKGV